MHTFIKAIGFGKKESQAELEDLIKESVLKANFKSEKIKKSGYKFLEFNREFAENIGIIVRGEEDKDGVFHIGNYFPYLKPTIDGIYENEVCIHKKIDSDAFTGMCDDSRLGISLIFFIQKAVDYVNLEDTEIRERNRIVRLAALAKTGTIILPTQKRIYSHIASKIDNAMKTQLMDYAKNGDMEALNYLTNTDIDKSVSASERIKHEDLFSIVETSFIPYGSESDLYSVLGNIISAKQIMNNSTGESIWIIRIICNDIEFEVAINAEDLMGFPSPGMRFKGVIWLQGEVEAMQDLNPENSMNLNFDDDLPFA
ncbi:MAG: DUF3881 family protein [Lachnospiraceae bacterium]|nr:DUF3881 family protein [Lachnospiraceae bacterium]